VQIKRNGGVVKSAAVGGTRDPTQLRLILSQDDIRVATVNVLTEQIVMMWLLDKRYSINVISDVRLAPMLT